MQAVFLPKFTLIFKRTAALFPLYLVGMKLNPILFSSATAALLLAATLAPRESSGQAASDEASIQALVTELAGQQTKIVENQSHIDEKLSVIAEDLRIARIFIGRGGGKTTAP